jgi:hypothetical protein
MTTFSSGLSSINGLTKQTQYLAVGTSGTDFAINSVTDTHTFNLPTASATNRGALSSANWSTFNGKQNAITLTTTGSGAATFISDVLNIPVSSGITVGTTVISSGTTRRVLFQDGTVVNQSANFVFDSSNQLVIGGHTGGAKLDVKAGGALSTDLGLRVRNSADTANIFSVQGDGHTNVLTRLNIGFSGMTTTGGALWVYAGNSGDYVSRWYGSTGSSIIDFRTNGNGGEITVKDNLGAVSITISGRYSNALDFANSKDIGFGTGGGTKIGYATNQKFAFWNATPIVQPTTAVAASTFVANTSLIANDTATFDGYTIGQIVKALRNIGILA